MTTEPPPSPHGTWTTARIVFTILGTAAAVVIVLIVAAVFWFQRNAPKIRELGQKATADGRVYGDGRTSRDCVVEAFRRSKDSQEYSLLGGVGGRLFLRSCLDVAAEPANFCDGVPPTLEIMKTVRWRLAQCELAGNAGDQTCNRLLQAIQDRCEEKR